MAAPRGKHPDPAEGKGAEAGKQGSGRTRHSGVDTGGRPHALQVSPAHPADPAGAVARFKTGTAPLTRVQPVRVDGDYPGDPFATAVGNDLTAAVEVANRNSPPSPSCTSVGGSNAPSPGWNKAAGFGSTVNASSTAACQGSSSPSWPSC